RHCRQRRLVHSAHNDIQRRHIAVSKERLEHRNVKLRSFHDIEPAMLHVADDTNDLVPLRIVRRERNALADRITVCPELPHKGTVDDRDWRRVRQIAAREITPTQERNLHRVEIVWTHKPDLLVRTRVSCRYRLVLDRETAIAATAAERKQVYRADRFNVRSSVETIEELLEECPALIEVLVLRRRQCEAHRQQARRLEPRFDFLQTQKTLHHQSRADQQHERERKLRDDEKISQPQPPRSVAAAASGFLEHVVEVRLRRSERGCESEDESGQ